MIDSRHAAWLALGASAVTLSLVWPRPAPPAQNATPRPAPRAVAASPRIQTIPIQGTFEPSADGVVTLAVPKGMRVRQVLVKSGDVVKAGQPVAVLAPVSSGPLYRAKSQSEEAYARELSNSLGAALKGHEESLVKAQQALQSAKETRDAAIGKAQADYDAELATAKRATKAVLDEAQTARDKAKKLADRDERALNEGWISRNEATASKNALAAAEQHLADAEAKHRNADQDLSVRAARGALERTQREHDAKLAAAQRGLDGSAGNGLAFAPAASGAIGDANLVGRIPKAVQLRAPVAGVVWAGTGVQEPGSPVGIVPANAPLDFVGTVQPAHAKLLRPGMVARLPGGGTGTVRAIGAADAKTGLVKVRLTGGQRGARKPGIAEVRLLASP